MSTIQTFKNLCSSVNSRFSKGLNDDNQVRAMLNFANKHKDLVLLIGYDTYDCIELSRLSEITRAIESEKIDNDNKYIRFYHRDGGKFTACILN